MATAESVKAKIQGLIDSSNEVTGNADTDLTTAVDSLIAGYGKGGASGIYMAQVTLTEDAESIAITHNLGTTDILLAACFAETLGDFSPSAPGTLSAFYAKTDIATRTGRLGYWGGNFYDTTNSYVNHGAITTSGYHTGVDDENTITFRRAGSSSRNFYGGVTYTVIVIAANTEV